jgi:hypothetical protein
MVPASNRDRQLHAQRVEDLPRARSQRLVEAFAAKTRGVRHLRDAVMSNHYHLVVHVDQAAANPWTPQEVIARWTALFSRPPLIERWEQGIASDAEQPSMSFAWRSSAYLRVVKAVRNCLQNADRVPELIVTERPRILLIGPHRPENVAKNRGR